jgi:ribosomal protein L12E/L44/L45/RPP1/RPP2
MKIWKITFIILGLTLGTASLAVAQEDPTAKATEEQQQKETAEKEKKAYALLEQVVDEAQLLRLTENRVRVQIGAADLLWEHNEGRARTLFGLAAEGLAEMTRNANANPAQEERRGSNRSRASGQLRQELILAVARHDATLAYQLLATTRPPAAPAGTGNLRFDSEDNLEERLLAQVALLDPKLALQNAEQLLDKGQYSRSLAQVLAQLQVKDKDAAAKLEDKLVKRLQSATIVSTPDAGNLALSLLQSGPRPADSGTPPTPVSLSNNQQILAPSSYTSLLGNVIDAALKAVPPPAGSQRGGSNNFRGRRGGPIGGGNGTSNAPAEPSAAELEQGNARRLLGGLQVMLPQIDQYLPGRSQAVRQKITELGMTDGSRAPMIQVTRAMQQGTSDSLMAAAPSAPEMMQSRIYQQAALRALDEGNVDRARQIANDHLESGARESVLQAVDFRQTSEKVDSTKMAEVRQTLAGLHSDDERIDMLVQLSGNAKQNNPKLAVVLLNEARQFTNRRATNYRQLEQQLMVADAFRDLDPARSFEILEPGIAQLNELLTAAATLSGFEVNVFQDGELPLEGRNGLSDMVTRYGQSLGMLATSDFDQAQTFANRFQLSESRIVARLSIVRSLLGKESGARTRGSRFDNTFTRRVR